MSALSLHQATPWAPLLPPSARFKRVSGRDVCSAAITAREFVTAADLASTWKVPLPIATQFLSVSGDDPCGTADPDACPAPAVSPLPMRTRAHYVSMQVAERNGVVARDDTVRGLRFYYNRFLYPSAPKV